MKHIQIPVQRTGLGTTIHLEFTAALPYMSRRLMPPLKAVAEAEAVPPAIAPAAASALLHPRLDSLGILLPFASPSTSCSLLPELCFSSLAIKVSGLRMVNKNEQQRREWSAGSRIYECVEFVWGDSSRIDSLALHRA